MGKKKFNNRNVVSDLRPVQVFDAVRHPAFDYSASGATRRLEFSEPTNRGFFTALARQMQFAGRKGCARTAFELAKLIHSLDPAADPMGMLLTIDYYALQVRTLLRRNLALNVERLFDKSACSSSHVAAVPTFSCVPSQIGRTPRLCGEPWVRQ